MFAIATLRDISIILLALMSIVVGVVMIVLLLQIRDLIVMMRLELKPLIDSTQETADTVRYTSQFMSKRVAKPIVNVMSAAAGVRQGVVTLRTNIFGPRAAPSPTPGAVYPSPAPASPTPIINPESTQTDGGEA